jgi:hypothetical protein
MRQGRKEDKRGENTRGGGLLGVLEEHYFHVGGLYC